MDSIGGYIQKAGYIVLLLMTLKVKTWRGFHIGQITKPKRTNRMFFVYARNSAITRLLTSRCLCVIPATTIILATESNESPQRPRLAIGVAHHFTEDFGMLAL